MSLEIGYRKFCTWYIAGEASCAKYSWFFVSLFLIMRIQKWWNVLYSFAPYCNVCTFIKDGVVHISTLWHTFYHFSFPPTCGFMHIWCILKYNLLPFCLHFLCVRELYRFQLLLDKEKDLRWISNVLFQISPNWVFFN